MVSHIDSFADYQKNEAWTWEHQALVRARPVAGNPLLFEKFNLIRNEILSVKRDKNKLVKDIILMRERLRKEKIYKQEDMFDLKQGYGGIIDIEFLIQYLVLSYSHSYPDLLKWTNNIKFIQHFEKIGILSADHAKTLKKGYTAYRAAIHSLNFTEKKGLINADNFKTIRKNIIKIWEQYMQI